MPITYDSIASTTLGTATNAVSFTSIPSTYTDLVLVGVAVHTTGGTNTTLRFNNDSTFIYSSTFVYGDGSTASSGRQTNNNNIPADYSASTTNPSNFILSIQNYANTTTNKTIVGRSNEAGTNALAIVGLWRSTSAINRIDLGITGNFAAGATFSLYGIKAA